MSLQRLASQSATLPRNHRSLPSLSLFPCCVFKVVRVNARNSTLAVESSTRINLRVSILVDNGITDLWLEKVFSKQ